jgi:hypothetical protein
MIFAVAIVAVALAIHPLQRPPEKRIPESESAKQASATDDAKAAQQVAHEAPLPATTSGQASADANQSNTDREPDNERTQWWIKIFTGVLAGVGVLQLVVMFFTLLVYWRQAGIMRSQWTVMQGQLGQMESAGRQTDFLIEQSTKQAAEMAKAATAANASAQAAETTADALIESERAWVGVTIKTTKSTSSEAFVWFWPDIMNYGRTPAHIIKVVVRPHQMTMQRDATEPPLLPPDPEYISPESVGFEREGLIPPSSGITPIPVKIKTSDYTRLARRERCLYVYGYIDYLDISKKPRQSRFCEMLWFSYGPADPVPAGFVTAGNTPPAYTKYT